MVYIQDLEGRRDPALFENDKVGIGSRLFDCVRIRADRAEADPVLGRYVRQAPCVVLLRPNREAVAVLKTRTSAGRLVGSMSKTLRKDFDNKLSAIVREARDLAKKETALQLQRDRLARLDRRQDRDRLQKEIETKEAALIQRREALYTLQPRGGKAHT